MTEEITTTSVLAQLRALVPPRPLTPAEARQIIERQTTLLLRLTGVPGPAVPIEEIVTGLPRVEIKRFAPLPSSGRTQWVAGRWVIIVASDEPRVRQRFSLGHELAHVVWHTTAESLHAYRDVTAEARLEQACEYFAATLLMPRSYMKRAFFNEGIQDVPSLARLFNVSWLAMRFRLEQLGLVAAATPVEKSAA